MIVKLKTNNDHQVIEFSNITDDSFTVYVRSNGFSGHTQFCDYGVSILDTLVTGVVKLISDGIGILELTDIESNSLSLKLDRSGHLEVSGKLIPHTVPHQMLEFGFVTDQTCLDPFLMDLQRVKHF